MNSEIERLRDLITEKISSGEQLIDSLENYYELDGVQKLQRKIKQELNFLRKVIKTSNIKKEHVQCSNLTHFGAVIKTLGGVQNCISVNKVVVLHERKITIDIICDGGLTWMKVIARNPKSLSQVCMGDASFGVRSVLDQAEDYVEAAKLSPILFQIPKIIFVFHNGVGQNLAAKIESFGIQVDGLHLADVDIGSLSDDEKTNLKALERTDHNPNVSHLTKVNLDVSAMLAYVSSVCNGSAGLYEFPPGVLAQQAEWERLRPQKPLLEEFFKGKRLYCCQSARDSFLNIVRIVGGPNEKIRADEFLKRIAVLPDDATADSSFRNVQLTPDKSLELGGKIKERSLKIFTFGDRIGAVTVTSNDGFVRSAKQQGINFVVYVHESRALTEQKEQRRGIKCL